MGGPQRLPLVIRLLEDNPPLSHALRQACKAGWAAAHRARRFLSTLLKLLRYGDKVVINMPLHIEKEAVEDGLLGEERVAKPLRG